MSKLQAIIFDADGTLADTERLGHRVAFNRAFAELGIFWNWDENLYYELLKVSGGKERMKNYVDNYLDGFTVDDLDQFVAKVHAVKTKKYVELVKSGSLPLREGVRELIQSARDNDIKIAIATTTTLENVESLLESQLGDGSIGWFEVIAAGDVVSNKKPAPDIYLYALAKMSLAAENCIALEDSHNGLESSLAANLKTIVTTNAYTANEIFTGAKLVVNKIGKADKPFVVAKGEAYGESYVNLALMDKILKADKSGLQALI